MRRNLNNFRYVSSQKKKMCFSVTLSQEAIEDALTGGREGMLGGRIHKLLGRVTSKQEREKGQFSRWW